MDKSLIDFYRKRASERIKYRSEFIRRSINNYVTKSVEAGNRAPKLSVILVGDDQASEIYVRNKVRACEKAGIIDNTVRFPSDAKEEEIISKINELNQDDSVDGVMVQLPLPKHLNADHIICAIDPKKDVDGFTPYNLGLLYSSMKPVCLPCTPAGIMDIIDRYQIDLEGKNAVVIGRSREVGLPMAKLLLDKNMTVAVCHSKTEDLIDITRKADLIVCAVGKPKFINKYMVKKDAMIIDVGINRVDGNLVGDVDYDSVLEVTKNVTPVPGGVGIMTITSLLKNTMLLYNQNVLLPNKDKNLGF